MLKKLNGYRLISAMLFLLVSFGLSACENCNPETPQKQAPDDAFSDYIPDPDIFMLSPDPEKIQDLDDGVRAPVNDLLIAMDNDSDVDAARVLAESLGASLVGQIPQAKIFQLRFADCDNFTELEQKQNQARASAGVIEASFNVIVSYAIEPAAEEDTPMRDGYNPDEQAAAAAEDPPLSACSKASDLNWIHGHYRAAFEEPGYYQLVPIMDRLIELGLELNQTTVCVADTGLRQDSGHFDDVAVLNVVSPGTLLDDKPLSQTGEHGTKVAGIIVADDGDNGPNGIASRVLHKNLRLALEATVFKLTTGKELEFMAQAVERAKARVVNMSYGPVGDPTGTKWIKPLRRLYAQLFVHHPQTLFVTAAGNDHRELHADPDDPDAVGIPASESPNDFPAGIQVNNLISVAATAFDKPDTAASFSQYGPRIDIAAPGEKVPVIHPYNFDIMTAENGTSFSSPLVAAAAAILFSIDPDLSGAEAKNLILAGSAPTAETISGKRLRYWRSIGPHLLSMEPNDEILDLIDRDHDGDVDMAGLIAMRICGGLEYSVEDYGNYSIIGEGYADEAEDVPDDLFAAGSVMDSNWSITSQYFSTLFSINCTGCNFDILHNSQAGIPAQASLIFQPNSSAIVGNGTSGTVDFSMCEILQRYNFTVPGMSGGNAPSVLGLEGRFDGRLVMSPSDETKTFQGRFVLPFMVPLGSSEALINSLEQGCIGGLQDPP